MAIANLTENYVRTLKVPEGKPDVVVFDEKLRLRRPQIRQGSRQLFRQAFRQRRAEEAHARPRRGRQLEGEAVGSA